MSHQDVSGLGIDEEVALSLDEGNSETPDDVLLELDALLKESVEQQEADRAIKKQRDRLKRKDISQEERYDLEAKVLEWEARREWDSLANVAVFRRQRCVCGHVDVHFSHMMLHQQHKTDSHAQRWVRATAFADTQTRRQTAELPSKVAYQNTVVPICQQCAASSGYDLNSPDALNWEIIQLAQELEG